MRTLTNFAVGVFCIFTWPISALASEDSRLHANVHLGVSQVQTGKKQDIYISSVPAATYTTTQDDDWSGLVGLSLLNDMSYSEKVMFSYGLSMYYLFRQSVFGEVLQAGQFNNLGYGYTVYNFPFYITGKATTNLFDKMDIPVYIDAGIGPNIMRARGYHEWRINPQTRPDNGFSKNTDVDFSATVGVGVHLKNALGKTPVECGYRIFYLGENRLSIQNNQFVSRLSTGASYANAFTCTLVV